MQQNDPLLKQGALDKHEDNGDHATIFTLIHHSLESECVLSYGGVKYVIKNALAQVGFHFKSAMISSITSAVLSLLIFPIFLMIRSSSIVAITVVFA